MYVNTWYLVLVIIRRAVPSWIFSFENGCFLNQGCVLQLKKVRTSGARIKMANCANVARERQPQNLERRKIRGWITLIPVLGKESLCLQLYTSCCVFQVPCCLQSQRRQGAVLRKGSMLSCCLYCDRINSSTYRSRCTMYSLLHQYLCIY